MLPHACSVQSQGYCRAQGESRQLYGLLLPVHSFIQQACLEYVICQALFLELETQSEALRPESLLTELMSSGGSCIILVNKARRTWIQLVTSAVMKIKQANVKESGKWLGHSPSSSPGMFFLVVACALVLLFLDCLPAPSSPLGWIQEECMGRCQQGPKSSWLMTYRTC